MLASISTPTVWPTVVVSIALSVAPVPLAEVTITVV